MTKDEALKLALEALDDLMGWQTLAPAQTQRDAHQAITSLRQAIEQAEKQEPVGEVLNERGEVDYISYVPPAGTLLYTAPQPQREWVGLTVMEAVELELATNHPREFAAAIEAKLKEKNT